MTEETKNETLSPPQENDPTQELQQQLAEAKDKYLRVLAEGENMRKRLAKEKQEMLRFGIENSISEFLPAIDNFEQACKFSDLASPEIKNWALGFQMILSQFKEVLHNHSIVAFHSEGNLFDPAYHDAVELIETDDVPEGTILQEFTKGYKSASRTIRPARVKVARATREKQQPVSDSELADASQLKGEKL